MHMGGGTEKERGNPIKTPPEKVLDNLPLCRFPYEVSECIVLILREQEEEHCPRNKVIKLLIFH